MKPEEVKDFLEELELHEFGDFTVCELLEIIKEEEATPQ